jgi:HK97 family phage major capsid protein
MNLKQKLEECLKAARVIAQKAKDESRELNDDERKELEGKLGEADKLKEQIAAAEKDDELMHRLDSHTPPKEDGPSGKTVAKSLGEHYVKHAGEKLSRVKQEGNSRYSVSAPEYVKADTDTQTTPPSADNILTQFTTRIVEGVRQRLVVADLLGSGVISGNAIAYFVEGAWEGGFAGVAENAAKPQVHQDAMTQETETLSKIAAFLKESDEMVEDLPFLVSAINNRLLYQLGLFEEQQLLSGDKSASGALNGILNRGVQTKDSASAADDPDAVFRAMTAVSTGSGLDADGIVINPIDYQKFRLSKDGNGQYFGGGFFAGQYGNGTTLTQQPPLWGMRTVVTPSIAAGTVLVGAFNQGATLYRKGGVRVETTNSDVDDFQNNRVSIRAEERVALAVYRPSGFVNVTLYSPTAS